MDQLRRKGLEKMNEVYAWEMPDVPGEFFALTVDHLFGRIWTRPGLSMRDRRMMLLAVLTTLNQEELLEVQVNAVLQNEELTREELREMAIFLTHYLGGTSVISQMWNNVESSASVKSVDDALGGKLDDLWAKFALYDMNAENLAK